MTMQHSPAQLVDNYGRQIRYLRISVTDRCDFRCVYCMSEEMTFLPRAQILSLEELALLADRFVALGVEKIRITGGEPLVRQGIDKLMEALGALKQKGLKELTMTTNGSQLHRYAPMLKACGMDRLNISLDSLDAQRFKRLTRTGDLGRVLQGIQAAKAAGIHDIKLNAVILKGRNEDEVLSLVDFARREHLDLTFIEEMPLGDVSDHGREETFYSSDEVIEQIESVYPLTASNASSLGPARYFNMADSTTRIGLISPHSHNFCSTCNRVRVTAEGRLLLCLGNEHSVDLRAIMRESPNNVERLDNALIDAMQIKPYRHHFTTDGDVQIVRMMNMTGG